MSASSTTPATAVSKPTTQSAKLVLLGESAVGKSSLVLRFVRNEWSEYRESTIGAAFLTKSIHLSKANNTVKFEIWDTAGQERYKSLAPIYYRNATASLVVYDITSPPSASFDRAKSWIRDLRRAADPGLVILLCGNKADLPSPRLVSREMGEAYAKEEGLLFMEASAKSGEGVGEIFEMIAEHLPPPPSKPSTNGGAGGRGGVQIGGAGTDGAAGGGAGAGGCAC